MKKKNILSLIFLLTILCGFNSCQDKPLDPIEEDPEYILCNGTGWFRQYRDYDGFDCDQKFVFYFDGGGKETVVRYLDDFMGSTEKFTYTFRWSWDEEYPYSIFIDYSDGTYSYFGDMYISPYELSGVLNDHDVTFEPF